MLSFKKSDFIIATIVGGKYNKKYIYYHDKVDDNNIHHGKLNDYINDDYLNKYKLNQHDMNNLKRNIYDDSINNIHKEIQAKLKNESLKSIKIFDDGIIIATPHINICATEKARHQLIAGPTGSGKSYAIGRYLNIILRLKPNKKIFLFSDVDNDAVLDKYKITRVDLTDDIIESPIEPCELSNSIVIFDDIDSISNKKLKINIENLRDSLLKRGRHEGIEVICTSHLLTDYKSTRIVLSEVSAVTLFTKSGSTNSINYLLSKYIGLSKQQIARIYDLPSRSITIYKQYPNMVISDKEIYIL